MTYLFIANLNVKLQKEDLLDRLVQNRILASVQKELDHIFAIQNELQKRISWLNTVLFIPIDHSIPTKDRQFAYTTYKRILTKMGFPPDRTTIQWLTQNSTRITELMEQYDDFFSTVLRKWIFPEIYILIDSEQSLSLSALMTQALLHYGNHVHPIWMERNELVIQDLNHLLPRRSMKQLLIKWLRNYDYHAIIDTIDLDDFTHTPSSRQLLITLTHFAKSMIARLNFHFEEAYLEWQRAKPLFSTADQMMLWEQANDQLKRLSHRHTQRAADEERIIELYQHLMLYLETQDFPAFLTRFYRFREAVLLFIGNYGKTKAESQPTKYQFTIHTLIAKLEDMYDEWIIDGYYGAYFYSKSKNVTDTLTLRNRSFVGHGRTGYSKRTIWREYTGYVEGKTSEGYRRFEHDTTIMLRDLGIEIYPSIRLIRNHVIDLLNEIEV